MDDQVFFDRLVGGCFQIVVPLDPATELDVAIRNSMIVEQGVRHMLQGRLTPDELIEFVEPCVIDIDQYIDEVEENLSLIHLT